MADWLLAFGGAIVGGVITGVANYAALGVRVKRNAEAIDSLKGSINALEGTADGLTDKFVTRREFDHTLELIRRDVHNISKSVGAIRDFLLSRTEAERTDLPK